MSPLSDAFEAIANALKQYDLELERAAASASVARRYELQLDRPPESMHDFRVRMVTLHRDQEERHRSCARLYRLHLERLLRWRDVDATGRRPVFMNAVADQLGMDSAAVVLFDDARHELLSAVSDDIARAVREAETVIGDGPALDIASGAEEVVATGPEVLGRWPVFASAIGNLGIRTVLAVPLRAQSRRLGALCAYSHRADAKPGALVGAGRVADALTSTVLLAEQDGQGDGFTLRGTLFDDADYPSAVNQAIGVIAARRGCDLDEARALLRARAFAEGTSLAWIADRLLEGDDL
ncbi:ANTAR domain-containing protein [Nocardia sp. ET3-3]|uniref:ANTAR domain-containing protein n=1 Tax=Nocardia terrae TaxID=2675851 RepID=A0A7K1UX64_9NOCA|nr:GAF and ANTAR domain-containing protein [Nocardia terrae]MVU78779.1 ANTAR domain-containing protein [Nocardia terrae]